MKNTQFSRCEIIKAGILSSAVFSGAVSLLSYNDSSNEIENQPFPCFKGEDGKYSYSGATISNIKLMRESVGPGVKIKAVGGVRTLDGLLAVQKAGCTRCGATATAIIIEEAIIRFGK